MVDNSYYNEKYAGKALIVVPHEDDEINVAGNLIANLVAGGVEIYVLYSTNGDWKTPAEVRFSEAEKALKELGVKEDHLIFLGYGDALNNRGRSSVFYHPEDSTCSLAGFKETYGTEKHPDFAYESRQEHSPYTGNAFQKDLRDAIKMVMADLIVCVDFDEHSDHRMLSLYFDRVMHEILKEFPGYKPQVMKRFGYSLAYTAKEDLIEYNTPSTLRPVKGETYKYSFDLIDKSFYDWEQRTRIPAEKSFSGRSYFNNRLVKAMKCHKSQLILDKAAGIINSDEVFWERRTDNAAVSAVISASSGNASYISDGLLYNVRDIDSKEPVVSDYLWQPEQEDPEKKIYFRWEKPQRISLLQIYGNFYTNGRIEDIKIEFDDGTTIITGPLPEYGRPLQVKVSLNSPIRQCTVSIVKFSGTEYGIAEIELFEHIRQKGFIKPFMKITIDDQFVYDYLLQDKRIFRIGLYTYGIDPLEKQQIDLKASSGASIEGNLLTIQDGVKKIRIEAVLNSNKRKLYDEIVMRKLSSKQEKALKKEMTLFKLYLRTIHVRRKALVYKRYIEEHGIAYSLSKIKEKLLAAR